MTLRRTSALLTGCHVRAARTRPWRGLGVAANSTQLRFPALVSDGFSSWPAATTRPYASCAVCWRCDQIAEAPFGILDLYSSPTVNRRKQSLLWKGWFPFPTVARALSNCWRWHTPALGDAGKRFV